MVLAVVQLDQHINDRESKRSSRHGLFGAQLNRGNVVPGDRSTMNLLRKGETVSTLGRPNRQLDVGKLSRTP